MNLERIVTLEELKGKTHSRIPRFVTDYMETGTGSEISLDRNIKQFKNLYYIPQFCKGEIETDYSVEILGEKYSYPFGISPMGMAGLIWPGSDEIFAKIAQENNFPFVLSTVSSSSPERIKKDVNIGSKNLWFQLYFPKENWILQDLLNRVKSAGIDKLIVTVDIPTPSIRERSKKSGVSLPLKFTKKLLLDISTHPRWCIEVLRKGVPKFRTIENYTENKNIKFVSNYAGNRLGGTISWETIIKLKKIWSGKIIIKGILSVEDAIKAKKIGVDAIIISNHGARQFDGGIGPLEALQSIRKSLGMDFPLFYDSGVRNGLDIMKALSAGADFVFMGRPFLYGVGAFGYKGAQKVVNLMGNQLRNNMMQLGVPNIESLKRDYRLYNVKR